MATDEFEETSSLPSGRKARQVTEDLMKRLEESAKRKVGFSKTATSEKIDELRKDLASASVRVKYDVTTQTERLKDGVEKLTFAARHRPKPSKDDPQNKASTVK